MKLKCTGIASTPTFFLLSAMAHVHIFAATPAPIPRHIPPKGIEIPKADLEELKQKLTGLEKRLESIPEKIKPEIEVFTKAVRLALLHGEFYKKGDVAVARSVLQSAEQRLDDAKQNWTKAGGLALRGYRSTIDGSAQPYGLEIPEHLPKDKPVPLYVWLHGRGDKTTDLYFIHQRLNKRGKIKVDDAIILHPFGRQCVGFKSAGEIDVLEAIESVKARYSIDSRRIVLMGFSMGGAGCWHLGAHYTDRFVAMSPGAGFAETRQYIKLKEADYPPDYEQTLWGLYDVPNYTRNLFNLPLVAYSGENDKQIQAARVMETAFKAEGRALKHLIGPGMGHKYHPDTLKEILVDMAAAVETGLPTWPKQVSLQTRTLRYNRMHWVEMLRLHRHWEDARVDARVEGGTLWIETKNVAHMRLSHLKKLGVKTYRVKTEKQNTWSEAKSILHDGLVLGSAGKTKYVKKPGLQGPIDDVFLTPFLVVLPGKKSPHAKVQKWLDYELAHFQDRWRALFRGELPVKRESEVTSKDLKEKSLILWGDPASNGLIKRVLGELPLKWNKDFLVMNEKKFASANHLPSLIHPSPFSPNRYIVLNSGPTFREAHDRTNSLQNPKLPDWAILNIDALPTAARAGEVKAADFFDETWQVKTSR